MIIKKRNTFLPYKKLGFIILESDGGFSLVPVQVWNDLYL